MPDTVAVAPPVTVLNGAVTVALVTGPGAGRTRRYSKPDSGTGTPVGTGQLPENVFTNATLTMLYVPAAGGLGGPVYLMSRPLHVSFGAAPVPAETVHPGTLVVQFVNGLVGVASVVPPTLNRKLTVTVQVTLITLGMVNVSDPEKFRDVAAVIADVPLIEACPCVDPDGNGGTAVAADATAGTAMAPAATTAAVASFVLILVPLKENIRCSTSFLPSYAGDCGYRGVLCLT